MPIHYLSRSALVITAMLSVSGCNINSLLRGGTAQDLNSHNSKQTTTAGQIEVIQNTGTIAVGDGDAKVPELVQVKDLWQRVRNGFRLKVPENRLVTGHIDWFKKHGSYINRLQKRSLPYLHFITQEAEKRGLPAELVLLPAVESAYRPFAYSRGQAAGLWQFVPSTGTHFKLKQNWWYDGRRDVVASTHAAFDYLESLAKRFDGNWELALAAYNSGAGTVSRAIAKNKSKGLPTDFWSLKLPRETCDYVPRLLALSKVIRDSDKYGISLKPIPDKPYFSSVDIGSQLDLALAADMADVTTDDLYMLNPGFNRWATAPDGPHRLNLPVAKVDEFTRKLAKLEPNQRIRWKRYKIRSGDSLSTIAKKHGTTSDLIRQANKLGNNSIRAGKYLVIPASTKALDHYTLSADKRKQKIQNRKHKGKRIEHVVKPGDNFWNLAKTYGVSHKKLARWNGMAPKDTLSLGQKLAVWVDDKTFKTHATAQLPSIMDVRPPSTRNSVHYRVREGDSLSTIAQRFKVQVADLKKWNTLEDKYLRPGQNIKLYVDVTAQTL